LRDLQKWELQFTNRFIDKTNHLNLTELIPSHWKEIKPAFSAGSYLTEVFDVSEIQTINEKYKSIAAKRVAATGIHARDSNNRRNFHLKNSLHAVNKKPRWMISEFNRYLRTVLVQPTQHH
jgi:hypothetical protein